MNRALFLSACVLTMSSACTDSRRAPAPPEHRDAPTGAGKTDAAPIDAGVNDAGLPDAGLADAGIPSPTPDGGAACSAQGLSPTPSPANPPLPPAVDSMRRRIVAAAVACDYAALAALGDEQGKSLRFSFGPDEDVARFWRQAEQERGEPVLARMVKLLSLPYTKQDELYVWPTAFRENATAQDFEALKGIYPDAQLQAMQRDGSYLGLRVGISSTGDWQLAVSGD
ncbi:hypothetical protein CYFUS_002271 [Cystobacter fuscus]|uniref:Lipoprotein n=1 Tax=Cystobacter fuscus TaxID=43 RepID=A0A250J110_9BACT|nr:hypothetical protein [Cystobacter fuscus]ATB36856.1 hypothetical protein CYFUS_002271 [Cystobacter fuscus]